MTRDEITAQFARWQDAMGRRDTVALLACDAHDCVLESPTAGTV